MDLEKHQITYNKEMGEVQVDIAGIKKDVAWLKQTYWVVVSASVGGLIMSLLNLTIK